MPDRRSSPQRRKSILGKVLGRSPGGSEPPAAAPPPEPEVKAPDPHWTKPVPGPSEVSIADHPKNIWVSRRSEWTSEPQRAQPPHREPEARGGYQPVFDWGVEPKDRAVPQDKLTWTEQEAAEAHRSRRTLPAPGDKTVQSRRVYDQPLVIGPVKPARGAESAPVEVGPEAAPAPAVEAYAAQAPAAEQGGATGPQGDAPGPWAETLGEPAASPSPPKRARRARTPKASRYGRRWAREAGKVLGMIVLGVLLGAALGLAVSHIL